MPCCHIALGGNLGTVSESFRRALDLLIESGAIVRARSSLYRTAPVGEKAGDPFLNAAASIETRLEPPALLDRLQEIETRLGRTRDVCWGPRTLDLDLLFYDDRIVESPRLIIPHPASWYRRFVLDPLAEIAPDLVHPVRCWSIRELRERLLPRPLSIALTGGDPLVRHTLIEQLTKEFRQVRLADWPIIAGDPASLSSTKPALILDLEGSMPDNLPTAYRRRWLSLSPAVVSRHALSPEKPRLTDNVRHILQAALDEPVAHDPS